MVAGLQGRVAVEFTRDVPHGQLRGRARPDHARPVQLEGDGVPTRQFVVEVMAGTRHLGLVVDSLSGQQDIIIRPLGRSLHAVRGFSGASELADERIALVLDPGALIEEASMSSGRDRGGRFLPNA